MIYVPGVLNVGATVVVDVDVPGTPPAIVQRTESGLPLLAVDVLVNVKLPPAHTVVSLAVKLAVAVGVVLQAAGISNAAVWSVAFRLEP